MCFPEEFGRRRPRTPHDSKSDQISQCSRSYWGPAVKRWILKTIVIVQGQSGASSVSFESVGKFITRVHRGDRAKWNEMADEAERLCSDGTPEPEAVARLIVVAGDNPRAFGGIGGKSTKGLRRTPEGQAALRLLIRASVQYDEL